MTNRCSNGVDGGRTPCQLAMDRRAPLKSKSAVAMIRSSINRRAIALIRRFRNAWKFGWLPASKRCELRGSPIRLALETHPAQLEDSMPKLKLAISPAVDIWRSWLGKILVHFDSPLAS